MGLSFKSVDLQNELRYFSKLACRYLEPDSREKLDLLADDLTHSKNQYDKSFQWQINKESPLKTITSDGAYEKSKKGAKVVGKLSFIWDLRWVDINTVELSGKSSTLVSIFKIDKTECVFQWHLDIAADPNAPGAVIHTQVKNSLGLSVPRFPSLLFTPTDCLDFLLGELFQECWPEHQNSHQQTRRFAGVQKKRLSLLLAQHVQVLKGGGSLSAWMSLKEWRPDDALFIR